MGFDEKQLRCFLAVADVGSIGRAAGLMNMSQPTMSRLIKNLEADHQVRLFERSPSGIVLTAAGNALVPHARHLIFELEQAANALEAIRGLKRGVVRVGVVPAVVPLVLAPAISRLRKCNPELHVEVIEGLDNRLLEALTSYSIDLMIASHIDAPTVQQIGGALFEDTFNICCAADHELASWPSVCVTDVLPGEWAMPPIGSTPRVSFEEIVRANGLPEPNVVIEAQSPTILANSAITAGVFVWLAGLASSELYAHKVTALDLPQFHVKRRFFVYRRSQGILSASARQFTHMLHATTN